MAKIDLRILKTKEKLTEALVETLKKDIPLYDVTISDLCDAAGISRATFYNNFYSVDDIFSYRVEQLEESIEKKYFQVGKRKNSSRESVLKELFYYVCIEIDNLYDDFYGIVEDQYVGAALQKVLFKYCSLFIKNTNCFTPTDAKNSKIPYDVSTTVLAGSLSSLILIILQNNDKYTFEEKQSYLQYFAYDLPNIYIK